jgi:hypothetical protein
MALRSYADVATYSAVDVDVSGRYHPPVALRVREQLAREREAGVPWSDQLFNATIRRSMTGANWTEKANWRAAFDAHRDIWRAAYQREDGKIFPLGELARSVDERALPDHVIVIR